MIVVSVMYPGGADATFDEGYYLQTHIPLVRERWRGMGLSDVRLLRGAGTPDGGAPPYRVTALLTFGSLSEFQAAAQAYGGEIFADIPKFTNVQPLVQINEILT
ncbi:MAG: EthD family reductase [Microvirga sp.]